MEVQVIADIVFAGKGFFACFAAGGQIFAAVLINMLVAFKLSRFGDNIVYCVTGGIG